MSFSVAIQISGTFWLDRSKYAALFPREINKELVEVTAPYSYEGSALYIGDKKKYYKRLVAFSREEGTRRNEIYQLRSHCLREVKKAPFKLEIGKYLFLGIPQWEGVISKLPPVIDHLYLLEKIEEEVHWHGYLRTEENIYGIEVILPYSHKWFDLFYQRTREALKAVAILRLSELKEEQKEEAHLLFSIPEQIMFGSMLTRQKSIYLLGSFIRQEDVTP